MKFLKTKFVDCSIPDITPVRNETIINLDAINYIIPGYKYGYETFYQVIFSNGTTLVIGQETYDEIIQLTLN